MFSVLITFFIGVLLGLVLRRFGTFAPLSRTTGLTVLVLLFAFGVSIGANKELIAGLGSSGLIALVMALLGTAGSFTAAIVYQKLMKKGGSKTE